MATKKKRLDKIRNSPNNVSFDELGTVLQDHGFKLDRVNGSHHVYEHEDLEDPIIIPRHGNKKVGAVYVKKVLDAIDKLRGTDAN